MTVVAIEKEHRFRKFLSAMFFWLLVLVSLVMLVFLAGIFLGFVPVKDTA